MVFALTPSDNARSHRNTVAQLRRAMREHNERVVAEAVAAGTPEDEVVVPWPQQVMRSIPRA